MKAPGVFRARFAGPCGLCDKRIHEDDEIVMIEGEACHVDCAEDDGYEVDRRLAA